MDAAIQIDDIETLAGKDSGGLGAASAGTAINRNGLFLGQGLQRLGGESSCVYIDVHRSADVPFGIFFGSADVNQLHVRAADGLFESIDRDRPEICAAAESQQRKD